MKQDPNKNLTQIRRSLLRSSVRPTTRSLSMIWWSTNPLSKSLYPSSAAARGDAVPAIVKVNHGNLEMLELGSIPHSQVAIPNEPDSGIRFRAIFDPRPLGRPELSEVLTLEFSHPRSMRTVRTRVKDVFPSSDSLPENLLRFYVYFSNPMQRGRSEGQIRLLGPDGRPSPDTLYRPPVELWDKSMRHLTILLDPGRLKRGVGPNRELGPPLDGRIAIDQGERRWSFTPTSPWTAGSYYVRIASILEDVCGNSLLEAFDRPLRSGSDLVYQAADRSILFHLA